MADALGYLVCNSYDDIKWVVLQANYPDVGEEGLLTGGDKYDLNVLRGLGIRPNGISAVKESRDLAAICLLVGLKVGNDTPNSCGKHFRWRVFSSAKQTEVQQYTEAGMHQ